MPIGAKKKVQINKLIFNKRNEGGTVTDKVQELNQFNIDLLTDFTP